MSRRVSGGLSSSAGASPSSSSPSQRSCSSQSQAESEQQRIQSLRYAQEMLRVLAADEKAPEDAASSPLPLQHPAELSMIPPPPYHHHSLHGLPDAALTTAVSPPSYPPSRPSSPPPAPSSSSASPFASADNLLPFLQSLSILGLSFTTGFATASTLRFAGRTVVASVALTSLSLLSLQRVGMADVHWDRLSAWGRDFIDSNAASRRGGSLLRALHRRLQRIARRLGGDEEEDDEEQQAEDGRELAREGVAVSSAAEDEVDKMLRAVEAVVVRVLSTASGVGFVVGVIAAFRR